MGAIGCLHDYFKQAVKRAKQITNQCQTHKVILYIHISYMPFHFFISLLIITWKYIATTITHDSGIYLIFHELLTWHHIHIIASQTIDKLDFFSAVILRSSQRNIKFSQYLSFVRGIRWSPVDFVKWPTDSAHRCPIIRKADTCCDVITWNIRMYLIAKQQYWWREAWITKQNPS